MKFKKFEMARQGNFIIAILLIHFIFFGYICNIYTKSIGDTVLYLYQVAFNPIGIVSLFILIGIITFMVFRENFYEYGIRNSFWLVPIIIGESFIWYWFTSHSFDLTILYRYFLTPKAYINILVLIGIAFVGAILGAYANLKYKQYLEKAKKISV